MVHILSRSVILALISTIGLTGCHTTYWGYYDLDSTEETWGLAVRDSLAESLTVELAPFGFSRTPSYSEDFSNIVFSHDVLSMSDEFRTLSGAGANVIVVLDRNAPRVIVKDHDNSYETEFAKSVKATILEVVETLELSHAQFERIADFIYY